ncbi:MAG: enoyl-CoA hydratase/isomerase family protein [Ignavibacteria bacterium]
MSDAILLEVRDAVATITLNRPQALNALNHEMARALRDAAERVEADASVRAVVVRGAGPHFMAGGDIKSFDAMLKMPEQERLADFEAIIGMVHDAVVRLRRMEKPVVAAVQGAVAGFGLSLMNACDLAVAADNAYFTLAYCHLGTSPDGGATWGLPRLVGLKQAMEIALLGDRFDARRALELGLVNRVVPVDALETETLDLAQRLAAGPTAAYAKTKRLLNESGNRSLVEQLQAEQDNFAASTLTEDFAEGVHAFVEKRKARFRGC